MWEACYHLKSAPCSVLGQALTEHLHSGGQSTQIKYLSKSTDTYNKILLQ